ncbi:MAG: hypothetical protein ACYC26_04990 [Phycisphaerales bacterium]
MKSGPTQRGFVLLLTLALVLLAGGLLSGLALRSVTSALDTESAVERLQRRWAVTTCRATLLEKSERLFAAAEGGNEEREADGGPAGKRGKNTRQPVGEWRVACRLAGLDYELVFTDEQAKLNVNALLKHETHESARRIIERLSVDANGMTNEPVTVKLHVRRDQEGGEAEGGGGSSGVGGYGQVFENVSAWQLIDDSVTGGASVGEGGGAGLAGRLTCWGDGRLNWRRASDQVLRQACGEVLTRGETDQLMGVRKDDPFATTDELIDRLKGVSKKHADELKKLLADASGCHGLWVIQRGRQRSWYTLVVGTGTVTEQDPDTGTPGKLAVSRQYEFQW